MSAPVCENCGSGETITRKKKNTERTFVVYCAVCDRPISEFTKPAKPFGEGPVSGRTDF